MTPGCPNRVPCNAHAIALVVVVEINVHLPSKDSVEDAPCLWTSNHSTSSSSCKFKDTGGGQDGVRPFIKESTEGDSRLWRKKMSLERRVKERMRSRATSKRKRIPDSWSCMKKRST